MFYVVCYDIIDDQTRNKVAKIIKGFGYRVQKSVFECPDLSEKRLLKLKDKIERQIDSTQDSVRFYRQCRACLKDYEQAGIGEEPSMREYEIIG